MRAAAFSAKKWTLDPLTIFGLELELDLSPALRMLRTPMQHVLRESAPRSDEQSVGTKS